MARLGQLALETSALCGFLDEAVALLADTLALPEVAVFELIDTRGELAGRAGYYHERSVGRPAASLLRIPAGRGSLPGYTLLEGEAVAADDLLADPRFVALAPSLGFGARAAISVPIRVGGTDWGVLGVYDEKVRTWLEDEVSFVRSAANVIALAVQRHHVEHELAMAEIRVDVSVRAGAFGSWTYDGSLNLVELDPTALGIHGTSAGDFQGTPDAYRELVHPEDQPILLAVVGAVLDGADDWDETYRVVRPGDGAVRWIHTLGRVVRPTEEPLRIVGVCADVTDRVLDDARLDESLLAEMAARRRAEQAGARLATLSQASALFSQSLEPDVILAAVAEFCVPLLADVCRLETVGADGELVTRAIRAASEARLQAFEELIEVCPGLVAATGEVHPGDGGAGSVSGHDGAPIVVLDQIAPEDLARAVSDPVQLAALQRLNPRAVVVSPLVAREAVIGRITLIETDHLRRQRTEHVAMVEQVAARAALALDNGHLHQSRARMLDSLQSVLAPRALPTTDGLRFAARYRVSAPHDQIGGDFYDAFEIGDDEWGVMVGDVCGRGADAAAITGLVRHSIRAAVVRDSRPVQVLAQTNDAVVDQIDDFRFCTATFMNVKRTPRGAKAVMSSAGHPRPVLVRGDGGVEMLDCAGVLLGVVRSPSLVEVEVDLAPGDAVVLYTDGVTEARSDTGLFGDDRLIDVLASAAGGSAEEIASALDDAVRAHHRGGEDDLAIVVVQAT